MVSEQFVRLEALFSSYVPEHLCHRLKAGDFPAPGVPERRWTVALFSDVSGFTPLSEALNKVGKEGSERLNGILYVHFTRMVETIHAHGGSVIKYGGDAASVLFVPDEGESEQRTAERSARCAWAMMEVLEEYARVEVDGLPPDFRLQMKIGIACGEMTQLVLGDESRLEFVAAGYALDQMAEAEHHAESGDVVVTEALAQAAGLIGTVPAGDGFRRLTVSPGVEPPDSHPLPPKISVDQARVFIHPFLAEQLAETGGQMVAEHRRTVNVFVAFKGIDYDDDPDAFGKLQKYFLLVHEILSRYGGHLNQVACGDKGSVMHIIFGAPVAYADIDERAVRAMIEVRDLDLPFITGQKIGVNPGSVFCGNIGSDARREYTALGDATNTAARLMGQDKLGQIACSRLIYEKLIDVFEWESLGSRKVKGKEHPIELFTPTSISRRVRVAAVESTFIGRQAELAAMNEAVELARLGVGGWVLVEGETGVGKTRLAEELIRHLGDLPVLRGLGQSFARGRALLPWSELLLDHLDLQDASPEERRRVLAAAISDAVPEHPDDHEIVGPALGWWPVLADLHLDPNVRRGRLLRAMEGLLVGDGAFKVVLVDDVQWLDPASRDLLVHLGRTVSQHPLLLVACSHPEAALEEWKRVEGVLHIDLNAMARSEVEGVVLGLLPGGGVGPEVIDLVFERSRGNPLFCGEIVRHLESIGGILRDPVNRYAYLEPATASSALPENVNELILARIDKLAERTRQILRVSSVLGRRLKLAEVSAVQPFPMSDDELRDELTTLVEGELLTNTGLDSWLFERVVVREVAYESLSFKARRQFHLRIAEYLEAGTEAGPRLDSTLANHFYLADETDRAFSYGRQAAAHQIKAYANEAARHHLDRIVELIPRVASGQERALLREFLPQRAEILTRLALYDDAFRDHRSCFELAHRDRDHHGMAEACIEMSRIKDLRGDYPLARTLAVRGCRFAERADWEVGQIRAMNQSALMYWKLGEVPTSLFLLEEIEEDFDIDSLPGEALARFFLGRGAVMMDAGRWSEAQSDLEEAISRARAASSPGQEISAIIHLAGLFNRRNDPRLEETWDRANRLCEEIGDDSRRLDLLNDRGNNLIKKGEIGEAEAAFSQVAFLARRLGRVLLQATADMNLGACAWKRQDGARALELYRIAHKHFVELGHGYSLLARANIAEVLIAADDAAVDVELPLLCREAREKQNTPVAVWAHTQMGLRHLAAGLSEDAVGELQGAVRLAEENDGPELANEAREALASLGA